MNNRVLVVYSHEHSDPYEPAALDGIFQDEAAIKAAYKKPVWKHVRDVKVASYMDDSPSVYKGQRMKEHVYRDILTGKERAFPHSSFEPYLWVEEVEINKRIERH
jgi:hypothetical protein